MTEFSKVTYELALAVAQNMRHEDQREIAASMFQPSDLPKTVAGMVAMCPDMLWCGWYRGKPVWIGGAMPRRPGVWELVSFATDDFRHIRFGVTRLATKVIIPTLFGAGEAHRVFATTAIWRKGGSRWLDVIGLKYEGTRVADLADGSDLLVYAKTRGSL